MKETDLICEEPIGVYVKEIREYMKEKGIQAEEYAKGKVLFKCCPRPGVLFFLVPGAAPSFFSRKKEKKDGGAHYAGNVF